MEKTVSVKTESDTVKIAVITNQNKIQTKPIEQINLQTDAEIQLAQKKMKRQGKQRINAH
jgi:hypothetical protein